MTTNPGEPMGDDVPDIIRAFEAAGERAGESRGPVVRRGFMVSIELDLHADTTLEDVALMIDGAFHELNPGDLDNEKGCKVYEVMERQP